MSMIDRQASINVTELMRGSMALSQTEEKPRIECHRMTSQMDRF